MGTTNGTNPMAGLSGLAVNPLFAAGSQILSNSLPGPTYRPMMMGVPQSLMQANQQAMLMQAMQRQQEDREAAQETRQKIGDALGNYQSGVEDYEAAVPDYANYFLRGGDIAAEAGRTAPGPEQPVMPSAPDYQQILLQSKNPALFNLGLSQLMRPPELMAVGAGQGVIDQSGNWVVPPSEDPSLVPTDARLFERQYPGLTPGTEKYRKTYAAWDADRARNRRPQTQTNVYPPGIAGNIMGVLNAARDGLLPPEDAQAIVDNLITDAEVPTNISDTEITLAASKYKMALRLKDQLNQLRKSYGAVKNTWGIGPGQFIPSKARSNYVADIDALRQPIQAITRVPGVGASSDFETRLSTAQLPDTQDREDLQLRNIENLDLLVDSILKLNGQTLKAAQRMDLIGKGGQPGAGQTGSVQQYDAQGGRIN